MPRRTPSFVPSAALVATLVAALVGSGCSGDDRTIDETITRDGGPPDAARDGGVGPAGPGHSRRCPGQEAVIRGTVLAPNGIDPLPKATVYLTQHVPPPFPDTVSCDACSVGGAGATPTGTHVGHDGRFSLSGLCPGNHLLVLESGRFRRVVELVVQPGQALDLASDQTRMPRITGERHYADSVPRIAVIAGEWDSMECVLRQMGLEPRAIDLYSVRSQSGSWFSWDSGHPDFAALARDLPRLKQYQILFFNCSMGDAAKPLIADPLIRDNLRDYVAAGGRLYVTDLAYNWIEQIEAFAPFIDFEPGPSGAEPEAFLDANIGSPMESIAGTVRDDDLARWLALFPGAIRNGEVPLHEFISGWAIMHRVSSETKVWVEGPVVSARANIQGIRPLTVSFSYQDCGKVLYTSYHTHGSAGGLGTFDSFPGYCAPQNSPQERILAYLIFDIVRCVQPLL